MKIQKISCRLGTSRLVIIIPFANIAIKIARIDVINALWSMLMWAELAIEKNDRSLFTDFLRRPYTSDFSLRNHFKGIFCNISEYNFSYETKNPLPWPTFYCWLGLINIQPIAYITAKNRGVRRFVEETTDQMAYDDPHSLLIEDNYTFDEQGHLRILDYASPKAQKVIEKWGETLYVQSRQLQKS